MCASSQGLGRACAEALLAEGVSVVINGRDAAKLATTADELRAGAPGAIVTPLAADITTASGRTALLAACPEPDILVTNNVGPKPGSITEVTDEDLARALELHYWTPISLVRAVLPGMIERRFGRIVNITSAMVKAPIPPLALSVSARLGLTGFVKAIAPLYAKSNVTINNLLPELFETDRLVSNLAKIAGAAGRTLDEEKASRQAGCPAGRFGRVEELGAVCAFYCSEHTGYLTGQNILLDGGLYPGTF